jgi:hypothetical protein
MTANVSMECLKRTPVGKFTITNTGYPLPVKLSINPANGTDPPFVDADHKSAQVGDTVTVFVNTIGLKAPGQYPIYINVKATVNKKQISQNIEGYVVADPGDANCGSAGQ